MGTAYSQLPVPLRSQRAQVFRPRESMVPIILAALSLYLLLIPQQFNITIAGVYLSPARIFLLGASLYVLSGALRKSIRFAWPDLLIILALAWIWLASYMSSGLVGTAIIMGGSHTVDMGLAYFLARATIQSPTDLRRFLILIAPGVAIIGAVVVIESTTRTLLLQPLASAVTGMPMPIRYEIRMGLVRGTASFPHPILAGIFLASFLPLYLLSGLRGWPRLLGLAASFGGIFTMSSAAMLGVVVGGLLSVYDWISERIGNLSWRLFLFFAVSFYGVEELASNSGFYNLLIRYASLNTASAYNRVLIWRYGTENIERHPWFGIGYSDWVRPDWMNSGSFDHFWLIMALRFGIPETVLLLGATLIGLFMVARRSRHIPPHDARLLRGVAISLSVFALGINSVTLWMSALTWFFMLLGLTVSLGAQPAAQMVFARPTRGAERPR
jgi:hypothetical protein